MIKLITWEMDSSRTPLDPEERMKYMMTLCEMTKGALDAGQIMMWGMNPGSNYGFAISERDEKEIFGGASQFVPHVKFKVEPMLSIDEIITTLKSMQQQT